MSSFLRSRDKKKNQDFYFEGRQEIPQLYVKGMRNYFYCFETIEKVTEIRNLAEEGINKIVFCY